MSAYLVRWEIEIEAETPEEAAREALRIQRQPAREASVFEIFEGPVRVAFIDLAGWRRVANPGRP